MSRVRVSSPAPQVRRWSVHYGGKYTTEKIIGSLVGVSGHTFDIVYDLFFTTERLVVVNIQHPADTSQYTSVWQNMFLGSFWSAGREQIKKKRIIREKRGSLQAMTPDELAGASPRNLAIPYSEVTAAEIRHRFLQRQLRFHVSRPSNTERIIKFNLSRKQIPEARRLLKLASLAETN